MSSVARIFNPKKPKPRPIPTPLPPSPTSVGNKAAQAAAEEKKKRLAKKGTKATRLTGGLGASISESNISRPTLLGGGRSV